jgi:RimJ/RimL family protein N-acetyltransferase
VTPPDTAPPAAPAEGPFEPEYPIRTARLLLRPYLPGDVDAVYAYYRLPQTPRYLDGAPLSRSAVKAMVTRRIGSSALAGVGEALNLVVELAQPRTTVGDCVLFWRGQGQAEIGYVFNPAHHGRGYATEAAQALLRLGFESLGMHRIAARCDARNTASARVMERAGMRREAHLVQNQYLKGEWTDELIYAILRSEWAARQPHG